ncbi:hypothetical protein ZWY2020_051842 [Hordeum vulgare]|nr:hypothetical protein ZWY2020_051842 [Hordeum vulgare]
MPTDRLTATGGSTAGASAGAAAGGGVVAGGGAVTGDSNGGATGGAQSSPPADDDDAQVDGPSEDGAGAPAAAKKKKKKSKATSAARPFYASPAINAVQMIMFGSEMPSKAATAERIPPPRFRYMVMRTLQAAVSASDPALHAHAWSCAPRHGPSSHEHAFKTLGSAKPSATPPALCTVLICSMRKEGQATWVNSNQQSATLPPSPRTMGNVVPFSAFLF